jgi:hypothetical protein
MAAALPAVLPKAESPRLRLGRAPTPPMGKPTAPMGVVGITGRELTEPPPLVDPARARTIPEFSVRTEDPVRSPPAPPSAPPTRDDEITVTLRGTSPIVKGATQAEPLIVPNGEAGAADAQLDQALGRALDGLGTAKPAVVATPGQLRAPARPATPLRAVGLGEDRREDVVIEADEPPDQEPTTDARARKARAIGDESEPEISIERLVELEVEEPLNERVGDDSSQPEILVITPGRAITAGDTQHVAGSIEAKKP